MLPELEIGGCQINTSSYVINAECTRSSNFQVVAQLKAHSDVHKLYTNQSVTPQTPVTIRVERAGEYQVSIFAIREKMGILNSSVLYSGMVMLSGVPAIATTVATTTIIVSKSLTTIIIIGEANKGGGGGGSSQQ